MCVNLPSSAPRLTARRWKRRGRTARRWQRDFESLCLIWRKPDGINKPAAWKAFQAVCSEHPAEEVLASAERWVAATPPRYLKKLEDWLGNGAWRNEPPVRGAERYWTAPERGPG